MSSVRPFLLTITFLGAFLGTALLVFLFSVAPSNAQFGIGGNNALRVEPRYPEPGSIATVRIPGTVRTEGATVRWFVDGVEEEAARNERSALVPIAALGEKTTVRATVSGESGNPFSATKTITPIALDIVVEAETTVPSFYKGRPLPSSGAAARVVAVPHTGGKYNPRDLSYKWELDGQILFSGPVAGKQSATLFLPELGDPVLSVTVLSPESTILIKKSIGVAAVSPEIHFYKENPLRSTGRRAIGKQLILTAKEATVRAEPYYMNTGIFGTGWEYNWKLDGKTVETGNPNPRIVTFRQTGSAGDAGVSFEVQNRNRLLQNAENSFTIFFEGVE